MSEVRRGDGDGEEEAKSMDTEAGTNGRNVAEEKGTY